MSEKLTFEADERDIAAQATQLLLNAYTKHHGFVPDLLPFKKPEVYDNFIKYTDSTLDILMKAINAAIWQIAKQKYPEENIQ